MNEQSQPTICPTCGQSWPQQVNTAEKLVALLSNSARRRNVYAADKGGYYVTYGGGPVQKSAIDEAVRRGMIVEQWPGLGLEYWSLAP